MPAIATRAINHGFEPRGFAPVNGTVVAPWTPDPAVTMTVTVALALPLVAVIVSVPVPAVAAQLKVVDAKPPPAVVAENGLMEQPDTACPAKLTPSPSAGAPVASKN